MTTRIGIFLIGFCFCCSGLSLGEEEKLCLQNKINKTIEKTDCFREIFANESESRIYCRWGEKKNYRKILPEEIEKKYRVIEWGKLSCKEGVRKGEVIRGDPQNDKKNDTTSDAKLGEKP